MNRVSWTLALVVVVLAAPGALPAQMPASPERAYKSNPVDTAHGDREFVLLWPEGAPGAVGGEPEDKPKITIYRATTVPASGVAAIVCPGGSYQRLASDHEGKQVAEWLNGFGVSAFVLQYRVGPRYRHPAPLQDAQRALRLVRARARHFGIDPRRLGLVGFSAGGHLASTAGTHFDEGRPDAPDAVEREGSRPDFLILGYPVVSLVASFSHQASRDNLLGPAPDPRLVEDLSSERQVNARTPPTFLFHTSEDAAVPAENSLAFYSALRASEVPAELHVFVKGRHGVGLAPTDPALHVWPSLCRRWMKAMGLLRAD